MNLEIPRAQKILLGGPGRALESSGRLLGDVRALKGLQRALECTGVPWAPSSKYYTTTLGGPCRF